ncbi:MAG TPA: carbohydrate-binding family 9-like protein [Kofleriaceae bacterium]|nr:carbohydrate-binding family 9-like protein [Kofleriaceae bacterium]
MVRSFLVAALLFGCVDQGSGPLPKRVDPGYVPKHLLQAAPPLDRSLDVDLGGKVVYLGNTTETPRIIPGQPFKITHYWKVIAPVGDGWTVFSMLRGAPNTADFMYLLPTDMQRAHKPETWRAGEIIEDEQEVVLRADWKSNEANLLVGLIAAGAHGQGDRMAASGPNVVDRAAVARTFEVDVSKAPPPAGTVHVPYAKGPITIDGVANDPGWAGAAQSSEFVAATGSPEPVGKATAKMTWDDQNLYLFATVTDTEVYSEFKNQDDPLWKGDCIEMFIDADGNKKGYIELQVSPNNVTFDSWFPGGRAAKGDEEWDSGMVTAVAVRGTADTLGDTDNGWDVEVAIPWAAVKGRDAAMGINTPPRVGDRWRLNVVRVDRPKKGGKDAAASWNRISFSDWHGLDQMLTVVFANTIGQITPNAPVNPIGPAEGAAAGAGAGSAAGPATGSGSGSASAAGSAAAAGSAPGTGSAPAAGSAPGTGPAPAAGSASGSASAPGVRVPSAAGSASASDPALRLRVAPGAGAASVPGARAAPGSGSASPAPRVAPASPRP